MSRAPLGGRCSPLSQNRQSRLFRGEQELHWYREDGCPQGLSDQVLGGIGKGKDKTPDSCKNGALWAALPRPNGSERGSLQGVRREAFPKAAPLWVLPGPGTCPSRPWGWGAHSEIQN